MQTDKDLYRLIGKRLRTRRRLLELTQSQVGRVCGVCFQQVQRHEAGEVTMTVARLLRLAEALDAPLAYFIEPAGDGPASPTAERTFRRDVG
jgi:transcriptional regulator with XRE-family HTH domain